MSDSSVSESLDSLSASLKDIHHIYCFTGEPSAFWSQYLDLLVRISAAKAGLIAVGVPQERTEWKTIAFSPVALLSGTYGTLLRERIEEAAKSLQDGRPIIEAANGTFITVKIQTGNPLQLCIALVYCEEAGRTNSVTIVKNLEVLSEIPVQYQQKKSTRDILIRQEQLASILDIMVLINTHDAFLPAAMTLCNELASRHHCEQVSVGWIQRGYVRIKAMSHIDTFEKKMDTVQKLELAMEEAIDQNSEILLPTADGTSLIVRDHEAYCKIRDTKFIASLPLRIGATTVAVCTLERNNEPFSNDEMHLLRLVCDQAVYRLHDIKRNDRWLGAHLVEKLKKRAEKLVGFEHTWAKVIAIIVAVLLAFTCFVPITYRMQSSVILRTDDLTYLTAPFDGHIEAAKVRVGDRAKQGDELLRLDQHDLLLEEAGLIAEKNRYEREAEKARASNTLADMRIAEAQAEQSSAQLEVVRYRLSRSVITAPFDGIVVEGDQMERAGSPVKQGDVLFKVARIERMYPELEVRESEIRNVKESMSGEIALASRPQEAHPVKVHHIEPAAVAKKDGNVFIVRGEFQKPVPAWWRPGMTGVAKLNAGKKTLLWIMSHRTVDFLRLRLWW